MLSRRPISRDLMRWDRVEETVSPSRAAILLLTHPGAQAIGLLRLQQACLARGERRFARLISLVNLRLTGAEFVPGCRVGPGLVMRHPQGIVLGAGVRIGSDCTILQHVTMGERNADGETGDHRYPVLGNEVVGGAGAVLLGGVRIGDRAVIGANAVVTKDVDADDVVAGAPAISIKANPSARDSAR